MLHDSHGIKAIIKNFKCIGYAFWNPAMVSNPLANSFIIGKPYVNSDDYFCTHIWSKVIDPGY